MLFSRNYDALRELNVLLYVMMTDKMHSEIARSESPFGKHRLIKD